MKIDDNIITIIIAILIISAIVSALLRLNHWVFKRIQRKRSDVQIIFLKRFIAAIICIIGAICIISAIIGFENVWTTLLGGTAVVTAIVTFSAQDLIKDVLGGIMISIHKPFEIGDRITMEDGTTGVVKDISIRHVVLIGLDTEAFVVPNHELNTMRITNYSYQRENRSAKFNFYVAYNSDMDKVIRVVEEAVKNCPYSLPGKEKDGKKYYGPVYFMGWEPSSFRISTTVYFPSDVPTEVLISDINLRVTRVLRANGIEIPYPYINVVDRTGVGRAD